VRTLRAGYAGIAARPRVDILPGYSSIGPYGSSHSTGSRSRAATRSTPYCPCCRRRWPLTRLRKSERWRWAIFERNGRGGQRASGTVAGLPQPTWPRLSASQSEDPADQSQARAYRIVPVRKLRTGYGIAARPGGHLARHTVRRGRCGRHRPARRLSLTTTFRTTRRTSSIRSRAASTATGCA
jgi:hypothetical protein